MPKLKPHGTQSGKPKRAQKGVFMGDIQTWPQAFVAIAICLAVVGVAWAIAYGSRK